MEEGPTTGAGSGADVHRRLDDVQEQAAATREILEALGRAGAEPGEILDTIIDRAAKMCRADAAQLYLGEDGAFRLSRVAGDVPEEFRRHQEAHPMAAGRDSLLGRVAEDRTTQQIADVFSSLTPMRMRALGGQGPEVTFVPTPAGEDPQAAADDQ